MKNIIMCAFAFPQGIGGSTQISETTESNKIKIYMENALVALASAKMHNPEDRVIFVTDKEPDEAIKKEFTDAGIENEIVPFDSFLMPDDFMWAKAFYKLCALYHISRKLQYDNILLLDTDTYTAHDFKELWLECRQGILLYEVGHAYCHHDREIIFKDYKRLYGSDIKPVHYGGEFIAGNSKAVESFMNACADVYEDMKRSGFQGEKNAGDETILSIAAMRVQGIFPANPYLFRFWTTEFYLTSTLYQANPVCIWHLPAEKDTGMRYLYRYFSRKGKFPSVEKAAKIMGLPKAVRPFRWSSLCFRARRKLLK